MFQNKFLWSFGGWIVASVAVAAGVGSFSPTSALSQDDQPQVVVVQDGAVAPALGQAGPGENGAPGENGGRRGRGGPGGAGGGRGRGMFGGGGGGFGGGRGGGMFGGGSLLFVVGREENQTLLQLNDEQITKIDELREASQPRFDRNAMPNFQEMSEEERTAAFRKMREDGEKKSNETDAEVAKLLTADQLTKAKRLLIQQAGVSGLLRDQIAAEMGLTAEQKTKLREIGDGMMTKMRETFQSEDPRAAMDSLRKETETAQLAVLTAEQNAMFTSWKTEADAIKPPDTNSERPGGERRNNAFRRQPTAEGTPVVQQAAPPPGSTAVVDFGSKTDESASTTTEGEAANPADGEAKPTTRSAAAKTVSFNFQFAPWDRVLKEFADLADLTLEMDVVPPGTFNYRDRRAFTPTEALDVINGYLLQKGYTLVRRDQFLVVVNIDNGIPPNLIPQVPLSELESRGRNELLSVVIPVSQIDPKVAADEITAMLGPQGKATPLSKTNRILVTDIGYNLIRVRDLMVETNATVDAKALQFRSFPCKHISANEADRLLRDLFGMPPRPSITARNRNLSGQTVVAQPAPQPQQPQPNQENNTPWWMRGGPPGGGPGMMMMPGGEFGGRRGRGGETSGNNGQPAAPAQPGVPPQQPQAAPAAQPASDRMHIAVDLRSSSLLVTATQNDLILVEQALKTIDVDPATSERSQASGANTPQLEVYGLRNADPVMVIDTLNILVPGLTITEDTRARKLNVYAAKSEQDQVRAILKQLDGESSDTIAVVPLRKSDATAVAGTLKAMYKGSDAPSIEADSLNQRILVRGSPDQVTNVKGMLAAMGEDGSASGEGSYDDSPVRTLSTGDADAAEIAERIKALWPSSDTGPSIRIVIPGQPGNGRGAEIRSRIPSGPAAQEQLPRNRTKPEAPRAARPKPAPRTVPAKSAPPAAIPESSAGVRRPWKVSLVSNGDSIPLAAALAVVNGQDPPKEDEEGEAKADETQQPSEAEKTETPDTASESAVDAETKVMKSPEVLIAPNGSDLIISSDDPALLNRIEKLVRTLAQAESKRTKWTVFYLRSADAVETATVLGNLFPQGSISQSTTESRSGLLGQLSGSLSSLGNTLMDATGMKSLGGSQQLRIIPETRMNALFVTGPMSQVREIEDFLRVLDAGELPESLKDRQPRTIPVHHADVTDVELTLKEVFKDLMEDPAQAAQAQQQRGGFNPFAMMMGGPQPSKARGPQLTVGTDVQHNTLYVNCNEATYQQVMTIVESMEKAAVDANSGVRFVKLETGNLALIEQALGSLGGKVTVSTTGSRPQSSGSNTSNALGGGLPGFGGMSPFGMGRFGGPGMGMMGGMPMGGFPMQGGQGNNQGGNRGGRGGRGGQQGGGFQGFGGPGMMFMQPGMGGQGGNGGRDRGGRRD